MKEENKKKHRILPWLILLLIIFGAAFALTYANQTGMLNQTIAQVRQWFGNETENSETEGLPQETKNDVKTLENAKTYSFSAWKEKIIMTSSNSVTLLDRKLNEIWYQSFPGETPSVATSNYGMVVYDKNGTTLSVITEDGKQTTVATDTLISASINDTGFVTAMVNTAGYKGGVYVYDNTGQALFKWHSGNWNVLDAQLSDDGKTLAISLLDTSSGSVSGNIMLFDIAVSEKAFAGSTYPDNMIAALKWIDGNTLYCIGDTSVFALSAKGNQLWTYQYTGTLTQFAVGNNGILALNMQAYSSQPGKQGRLEMLNSAGKKTGECTIADEVKKLTVFQNNIYAMTTRDIYIVGQSGKEKSKTSLEKDMRSAYIVKPNEAVVFYGTKLETVPLN